MNKPRCVEADKIKRIDLQEFRNDGYLQELNRQFLHPLGLALEVIVDDFKKDVTKQKVLSLGGVWDYRDDPEGMAFGDLSDKDSKEKAKRIKRERIRFAKTRKEKLGFIVQPIGHKF